MINQIEIGEVQFIEIMNASLISTTQKLQIEIQTSVIGYWKIQSAYAFGLISDGFTPPSWNVIVANDFTNSPVQINSSIPLILNQTMNSTYCTNCAQDLANELCFNGTNNITPLDTPICFPRFLQPANTTLISNKKRLDFPQLIKFVYLKK